MSTLSAVAAGLGSAVCFGAASAGQHVVASDGVGQAALDPRLLLRLVRSRAWLLAGLLELAAVGLQLLALRWGAVALVQPLLVLGLPLAVLLAARFKQQHIARAEWTGVVLCAAGVGAVAALLPGDAPQQTATPLHSLVALAVVLAAAGAAGGLVRSRAVTGAAAGVSAGVGAAALALCGPQLSDPGRLLTDWPVYLAVAAGLLALQLGQAAFQDERLGAPLGAATLAEPVAAVALSALVLHERLVSGLATQLACALAVAVAVAGVAVLVRHEPA